jgi:hypothetical protein
MHFWVVQAGSSGELSAALAPANAIGMADAQRVPTGGKVALAAFAASDGVFESQESHQVRAPEF